MIDVEQHSRVQGSRTEQDLTQATPSTSSGRDISLAGAALQAPATEPQGLQLSADLIWHSSVPNGEFCILGDASTGPHPHARGPEHAEGRKPLGQYAPKASKPGVSSSRQSWRSLPTCSMLGFASSSRFRVTAVALPPGCCAYKLYVVGVGAFGGLELSHIAACLSISVLLTAEKLCD